MNNITKLEYNYSIGGEFENEGLSELETHVLSYKDESKNRLNQSSSTDLIKNIGALSRYLFDKDVKWYKKSLVVATIAYFVKPKKALREWDEFFGFLEDIGAVEKSVKFLEKEIKEYY